MPPPSIHVCKILINYFIVYRKLNLITSKYSDDDIIVAMEDSGYFKIETDQLCILVLHEESDVSNKKEDFTKAMSFELRSFDKFKEIMFVLGNEVYEKKSHIINEIMRYKSESTAKITIQPYSRFVIPVPYHPAVCKHEIITHEEVLKFCILEHITEQDLPALLINDPPIVWLGGETGQYVQVQMNSNTATIAYKIFRII